MGADCAGRRRTDAMLFGLLGLVVAGGIGLRWKHLVNYGFLLNGDDGVVALMAMHMLQGEGLPLVFYGQHYMGTLDAMVAALLFGLLGISAETYKLGILLHAGLTLILVGWAVVRQWGPTRACLAVGLLAVSPAAIRWQMDPANYGLLFLFAAALTGLTLPLLADSAPRNEAGRTGLLYGWAFVAGLGFWMHSLVVSLVLPVPLLMWLRGALPVGRKLTATLGCFALGALPLLLHNLAYPLATPRQFAGFFLDVSSRSQVEHLSAVEIVLRGLWHKLDPAVVGPALLVAVGGYSLRDYPALAALSYPAVLAFLTLLLAPAATWGREARVRGWRGWVASGEGGVLTWLLLSAGLVVFLGSTRARYMALLVPLAALLLAGRWSEGLWGRRLHATLLGGLLLYLTTAALVLNVVRPLTLPNPIPALARFLETKGLTRGYAGHELAFPLVVETRGAVLVSSLAGPVVNDQYPPYTRAVEAAPAPFYLYAEQEPLGLALLTYLRGQGVTFQESPVDGHRVFWGLSRAVRPDEFLPEPYLTAYRRARGSAP